VCYNSCISYTISNFLLHIFFFQFFLSFFFMGLPINALDRAIMLPSLILKWGFFFFFPLPIKIALWKIIFLIQLWPHVVVSSHHQEVIVVDLTQYGKLEAWTYLLKSFLKSEYTSLEAIKSWQKVHNYFLVMVSSCLLLELNLQFEWIRTSQYINGWKPQSFHCGWILVQFIIGLHLDQGSKVF